MGELPDHSRYTPFPESARCHAPVRLSLSVTSLPATSAAHHREATCRPYPLTPASRAIRAASPGFQIGIAVNGDRDHFALARLGVDVVAPADAPERPAVCLNQPAHLPAGDRFQTATSRI